MSVKSISKRVGNGLLDATAYVVVSAHNDPREKRIAEIDETMKELQEERAQLVSELL